MKQAVKNVVKSAILLLVKVMEKTKAGRYFYAQMLRTSMERVYEVKHQDVTLLFAVPNALNHYRAATFSTKEPETLEWIDGLDAGSVVWDIGANVGLYSCYAAKRRGCRVFAFEPSVFNLELLARNIFLNGLTDQITIVPLPLSEALAMSTLNMTSMEWGGALSTFGQEYGHDGQPMVSVASSEGEAVASSSDAYGHLKVFDFPTLGLSMDEAVDLLAIPRPDYIKMDVDGIEHLILKGGVACLRAAKGVLIEINDSFSAQANDASMYLQQAGFTLSEKRHAEEFNTGVARHTFNQIWVRPSVGHTDGDDGDALQRGGVHDHG